MTSTGAARLCARSAVRIGVGIVKIGVHGRAVDIIASHETSSVPYLLEEQNHFIPELNHPDLGCLVIGLGLGTDRRADLLMDMVRSESQKMKILNVSWIQMPLLSWHKPIKKNISFLQMLFSPFMKMVLKHYSHLSADKITRARKAAAEINATILFDQILY